MENNRGRSGIPVATYSGWGKQLHRRKRSEMGLIEKLGLNWITILNALPIQRLSNDILDAPISRLQEEEVSIWCKMGIDMQSEHERYLVEKHFKNRSLLPTIQKILKHFTCASMKMVKRWLRWISWLRALRNCGRSPTGRAPGLVGAANGRNACSCDWNGLVPSIPVGLALCHMPVLGLVFERMVQFVTGMGNIRDVIVLPRTPKNCVNLIPNIALRGVLYLTVNPQLCRNPYFFVCAIFLLLVFIPVRRNHLYMRIRETTRKLHGHFCGQPMVLPGKRHF